MIVPTLLILAATTDAPVADCTDPKYQVEMNLCEFQRYERSDTALNAQWAVTSAAMKHRDAESHRGHDTRPGDHETLLEAQRAWLTYRDRHCANEGYLMRGGSAEPMLISGCRANLTDARTAQLKELIEEY